MDIRASNFRFIIRQIMLSLNFNFGIFFPKNSIILIFKRGCNFSFIKGLQSLFQLNLLVIDHLCNFILKQNAMYFLYL